MSDVDELIIVSNRLPVVMQRGDEEGGWEIEPGSGGLVQAMSPILERLGGQWVGWPGIVAEDGNGWASELDAITEQANYALTPVILTRAEVAGFYAGFANSIIWPLFHGFADRCVFEPRFYRTYLEVNQKFARRIRSSAGDNDFFWIHDYHLIHLGQMLREMNVPGKRAFFLHIPFPSLENFSKLPWRDEILEALLAYDLVGFQTARDRHNFLHCVEQLQPQAHVDCTADLCAVEHGSTSVTVGVFPIGCHFEEFSQRAASDPVTERVQELREEIGPYQLLLGVDRLDYSKGLLHRLWAFEQTLDRHPDLCEEVVLFQLLVPSRESVPEYQALKREVDRIIGRINGRFSTPSWQPIRYLYNTVEPEELSALYRMASVAVVTPLRDGMNLVAKEYCASQVDLRGVLVLSEFAGAAAQLDVGALLVNPYDIEACATAYYRAVTLPEDQRAQRMRKMRTVIKNTDVFWWADSFLQAVIGPEPSPSVREVTSVPVIGDLEPRAAH